MIAPSLQDKYDLLHICGRKIGLASIDLAMRDAFRKMRRSHGLSEDEAISLMSVVSISGFTRWSTATGAADHPVARLGVNEFLYLL